MDSWHALLEASVKQGKSREGLQRPTRDARSAGRPGTLHGRRSLIAHRRISEAFGGNRSWKRRGHGSRAIDRSLIKVHQSRFREIAGMIFNGLVKLFTGLPFHDTQCGFKAFVREPSRIIFEQQRVERFGFDPEVIFRWGAQFPRSMMRESNSSKDGSMRPSQSTKCRRTTSWF